MQPKIRLVTGIVAAIILVLTAFTKKEVVGYNKRAMNRILAYKVANIHIAGSCIPTCQHKFYLPV